MEEGTDPGPTLPEESGRPIDATRRIDGALRFLADTYCEPPELSEAEAEQAMIAELLLATGCALTVRIG